MDQLSHEQTIDHNIYDCIGVGFGPSNIAVAIALEERGLLQNTRFLEAREAVSWHPGMLIEGSDIQHNPLRDFVTPRNPRSPHGFLSYLKNRGRLFDYLNLASPLAPRVEYAAYVNWVAQKFEKHVEFDCPVSSISTVKDVDEKRLLEVHSCNHQTYLARTVVVGCGRSQNIPTQFTHLLGDDVIHSDDYLWSKQRWLKEKSLPRIAVVGGSQSAIEILLDLSASCSVLGIVRGFGIKQKDLSPFTERIYFPEFVDYFHNLDVYTQRDLMKDLWRSNYSAADVDVINALTFKLYEQRVTGKSDIELYSNTRIEEIECDRKTKKYRIILAENSAEKRTSVLVDGIVFATGYKNFGGLENQEPIHPILETIVPDIHFRDDGGPEVQRDYRLKTKNPSLPPVYLNGLCESSHGFGDAGSFSLLSVRSDVIAVSLSEHLQKSEDDRKAQMPEVEAHV